MSQFQPPGCSRRHFIQGAAALLVAPAMLVRTEARSEAASSLRGRIFNTLKLGMVQGSGSLADKFQAAKDAGFEGIEPDAPGMDVDETKRAIAKTGLVVDGTVCATHWQIRHTSPDAEERAQALKDLQEALRQTRAVGGHSVLLVAGHGQDGPEDEIWERSVENIAQAIPVAAEVGVYIAIENVWNHFLYDHDGGPDQTADKFAKYIDEFNSPWVGMQFDIGNHWKYGSPADWIRTLGRRVMKLDAKGFSRQEDRFTDIGAGDIDWADVRDALLEIGFSGWSAAEVRGGGPDRLREVLNQMNHVFDLA